MAEKASLLPPATDGNGALLVRRDLMDSGAVKTMADLKGRRIAVISLQSASLNFSMRALKLGGLGREEVTWVEMPFNQMIAAFEKKAIDAAMMYTPYLQLVAEKLKTAIPIKDGDLSATSTGDALNIMMYSPDFAKTEAAKRFMVAHLKAQRDIQRMVEGKADLKEACRAVAKYVPSMSADCQGMKFSGIDPDGRINVASLERYQDEWMEWGVMKERADIRSHVNGEFSKHAVSVLGPYQGKEN
ncbi:alkanesulfonate transporter substrate-binding subunit [Pigmentiphaga humi]|uniref:Alkanesulfonate transporter substrate-binding subunit n=1 Tax=Pigmentiphaga humi TaxID=2478468 RepID=A0A3P4AYS0_9BURK|nr:ABC transporter substrate-binding protein [Pigmentiphaga humi]VCU68711.1 alkanesulfonate transporter substrate-binding subunit [Pigmentiphaga humi]